MLDQLKGARVELKVGSETVSGAIVGGRLIPGDDKRQQQEQVTLLLDSGELRNVDLTAVAGLRFTDPKLQASETDGSLFWKMTNGRGPMPSWRDTLSDQERWQLVNYIRKLGKDAAKK